MTDNGTLPLTTQVSEAASHNEDKKTYCFKVICQHSIREAGESQRAPWAILLATRLLYSLTFLTLFILSIAKFGNLLLVTVPLGFSAVTFSGLTICTYLQGTGASSSQKSGFSTAVVSLTFGHGVYVDISLFCILYHSHEILVLSSSFNFSLTTHGLSLGCPSAAISNSLTISILSVVECLESRVCSH